MDGASEGALPPPSPGVRWQLEPHARGKGPRPLLASAPRPRRPLKTPFGTLVDYSKCSKVRAGGASFGKGRGPFFWRLTRW